MPMSRKHIDAPLQPQEALGRAVRARRTELDLSQEALAAACDLDRTYVSGIERGLRNPTVQTLWLIAKGLGLTPHELIAATEDEIAAAGSA
jgi:transcriptional regulator with XRE-family HTH domain